MTIYERLIWRIKGTPVWHNVALTLTNDGLEEDSLLRFLASAGIIFSLSLVHFKKTYGE